MTTTDLPDQPDGIEDDSRDLPNPTTAAGRVNQYICAAGDGLYDIQGGAPLYARDLEAITRAATKLPDLQEELSRRTHTLDLCRQELGGTREEADHAIAERTRLVLELGNMRGIAQGNKRHVATLTAILEAVQQTAQDWLKSRPIFTEAARTILETINSGTASVPGSSRRAPEPDSIATAERYLRASGIPVTETEIRAWLDERGIPVMVGVYPLFAAIRQAIIAAGDAGFVEACRAPEPVPPTAPVATHAQGYAEAVARLRDDDRYRDWWTALPKQDPAYGYWQGPARRHLADYLETVGPDGVDVTTGRWPAREHAVVRAAIAHDCICRTYASSDPETPDVDVNEACPLHGRIARLQQIEHQWTELLARLCRPVGYDPDEPFGPDPVAEIERRLAERDQLHAIVGAVATLVEDLRKPSTGRVIHKEMAAAWIDRALDATAAVPTVARPARSTKFQDAVHGPRDWLSFRAGSGRQHSGERSDSCPGDGIPGHRHDTSCIRPAPAE